MSYMVSSHFHSLLSNARVNQYIHSFIPHLLMQVLIGISILSSLSHVKVNHLIFPLWKECTRRQPCRITSTPGHTAITGVVFLCALVSPCVLSPLLWKNKPWKECTRQEEIESPRWTAITRVAWCRPAGKTGRGVRRSWSRGDAGCWQYSVPVWGERCGRPCLSGPSRDTRCPPGCCCPSGRCSGTCWLRSELPGMRGRKSNVKGGAKYCSLWHSLH